MSSINLKKIVLLKYVNLCNLLGVGFIRQQLEAMLQPVDTTYSIDKLKGIAKVVSTVPEGVKFLRKAERILKGRNNMVFESNQLDWGMAETLAYGTLMEEGYDVRISGQDVERGTFSHRHAILRDEISEERINLLNTNPKTKGEMRIYNSLIIRIRCFRI